MRNILKYYLNILLAVVFVIAAAAASYAQPEAAYEKAVSAYVKKDFRTAVKYLKEYVAEKPSAEAYYLLGYSTYMLKKKTHKGTRPPSADKEATDYFRQAYLIDPDFSPRGIEFKRIQQ